MGGTIQGAGTLIVQDSLDWTGGNLTGTGELRLEGVGAISGSANRNLYSGIFRNKGRIAFTATGKLYTMGAISVLNEALWDQQSNNGFEYYMGPVSLFRNQGTLRRTVGTGTSAYGMDVENYGDLLLQSGALRLRRGFTQYGGQTVLEGGGLRLDSTGEFLGGRLAGDGTLTGSVDLEALVEPGNALGRLAITDGVTWRTNAVTRIEIAGNTAATNYDHIAIGGKATLDGELDLVFTNNFSPSPGNEFFVIGWGAQSGGFDATNITWAAGALDLDFGYTTTGLVIRIVGTNGTLTVPDFITSIAVLARREDATALAGARVASAEEPSLTTLTWEAPAGLRFGVESSVDLETWAPCEADVDETSPGHYVGHVAPPTVVVRRFFRLRRLAGEAP